MRYRVLLVAAGLLTASASIYGQAKLAGKWQTDNVPAALEAQKKVDGSGKISGTVTEIGNPPVLNIDTGTITGKTITWVTQPRGVTWSLEMTDDDTVTLTGRAIPGRGGAGGGKGPAPEAAPGATPGGAPPAGGDGAPKGGGGGRGAGRGPQQPIVFHRVK
jgi:hypothetical protein